MSAPDNVRLGGVSHSEGVIGPSRGLRLRPMRDDEEDYARVVEWRNQPHVREWWDPDDPPMTLGVAVREYRPSITGVEPDRTAFIEVSGVPVGFVQYYPWAAFADELAELKVNVPEGSWGLDIYVGEPDQVDRGIGSRTVKMLCDYLFAHEGATAVAFGVERTNSRARRAYEKAGMEPTVEFLDTDTRGGQRVISVLMVRMAPRHERPPASA